jgi:peptidoglycan/xylan/chitin deacetylase (PgdA/CDA1 family)
LLTAALFLMIVTACNGGIPEAEHLSFGCREGRSIALTFDDGPNPQYTEQVLGILRSHNAVATFFDEGQAAGSDHAIVKRELARGMVVGSHPYTRSVDLPSTSRADFARDLQQAEHALTPALGYRPGLYRAPYGHTSDNMLAELRAAGYTAIGWDLDGRASSSPGAIPTAAAPEFKAYDVRSARHEGARLKDCRL